MSFVTLSGGHEYVLSARFERCYFENEVCHRSPQFISPERGMRSLLRQIRYQTIGPG
jgi:hypothetical protein